MGVRVTPACDSINTVVICNAPNIQQTPDVAFGDSNYLVVWSDGRAASYYRIYAARVTPGGTVLDPIGIQVGPSNNLFHYYPSVAFNGTRFFTVWTYGTSPYDLMGCFINQDGTLGDTISISKPGNPIYSTRLAFDGTNFLIAWVEYTGSAFDLKGMMVSGSTGAPIGASFTIASAVQYDNALGLCYRAPDYKISYSALQGSLYQIFGCFYNPSGQPVGSAFQISNSPYNCYQCDVIPGADDRFLNIWAEARSTYDIYGNADIQTGISDQDVKKTDGRNPGATIIAGATKWRYADRGRATVYCADGRKMGEGEGGVFDCSFLRAGVYFLVTETGETIKAVIIGR
jgi:hypothetical protein